MITSASTVPSPPSSPPDTHHVNTRSPDTVSSSSSSSSSSPTVIIPLPLVTTNPRANTTATIVSNQGLSASDFQSCRSILSALQTHSAASPFLKPVHPVAANAPDYFSIVKYPMDLSTVEKKLSSGLYNSVQAFGADIDLMLSNCFRYNPDDGHPIHKAGKLLKMVYNNLLTSHFPAIIDTPVPTPTIIYQPALNTNVYQPPNALFTPPLVPSQTATRLAKTLPNSVTVNRSRRKSAAKKQWVSDAVSSIDSLNRRQSSSASLGSMTDGVVPSEPAAAAAVSHHLPTTPSLLPLKKSQKRPSSTDASVDPPAKKRGKKAKKPPSSIPAASSTSDPATQLQMLTQQVAIMSAMLQQATAAAAAAAQQSSTDESDNEEDYSCEGDSEMGATDPTVLQQEYLAAYASAFAQPVIDAVSENNSNSVGNGDGDGDGDGNRNGNGHGHANANGANDVAVSPSNSQPESTSRASSLEPKYSTRSATRALNPDAESPRPRRLADPPAPTIRNRKSKSNKKSPRKKSLGPFPAASHATSPMPTKRAPVINGHIIDSNYLADLAERIALLPEQGQVKIAEFVKTSKSGWTTDLEGELEIDFDLLEEHVLARIDDYCRHHLPSSSNDTSNALTGDIDVAATATPPYGYGDVMLPIMDFGLNPMPMAHGGGGGTIIDDINFGENGDDHDHDDIDDDELGNDLENSDMV
ncbi:hypothetical protein SeMB42_g00727 [Synchytrium endobioticum]|uniref:Bromo domain-containing protein n=1 Tax=Synchytrium endobioticum TaxID=286115 RepID=A0A507DPG3_9FUNG|nr:hypothetical protein SeMB42_g00727 [Synchytrium endobioticum]